MAKSPSGGVAPSELEITRIHTGVVTAQILGTMPLIFNRMAEKAKRDLLLGGGRKTAADRAQNLKHNPPEEYRGSVYRHSNEEPPTRLRFPSPGFKGAMMTAALRIPGAKKTEVAQLVWVTSTHVDVWGVPELKMDVVRSADQNRTPDIRTRAILPKWACEVTIRFVKGQLNETAIANLLFAAGLVSGIGDFRQEKGKGNFGQFSLCEPDDAEFLHIKKNGDRELQDAALHHFRCYDEETQELIDFFDAEVLRRGRGSARLAPPGHEVSWDEADEPPDGIDGHVAARNGKARTKPERRAT